MKIRDYYRRCRQHRFQQSTIHGLVMLAVAGVGIATGYVPLGIALPMIVGGLVAIIMPERSSTNQQLQAVAAVAHGLEQVPGKTGEIATIVEGVTTQLSQ